MSVVKHRFLGADALGRKGRRHVPVAARDADRNAIGGNGNELPGAGPAFAEHVGFTDALVIPPHVNRRLLRVCAQVRNGGGEGLRVERDGFAEADFFEGGHGVKRAVHRAAGG